MFAIICTAYGQRVIEGSVKMEGKGVIGVIVSSGFQFTTTDKKGKYRLAINEGNKFVQITSPSGYLVPSLNSIPQFYKALLDSVVNYDFSLIKNRVDDSSHTLVVQTDVQVANEDELNIYKEQVLPDLKETIGRYSGTDIVGVDLGDIVGDDTRLFAPYTSAMNDLGVPFYRLIGNHDMAYWGRSFETSEVHFNRQFGPTTYSFNKGNVHYVVLNNNFFFGRDYFYMGYIDEYTFRWLERDLSYVPKGSTVFVMMHIPSQLKAETEAFEYNYSILGGTTVNASALYNMLADYNVHLLSGHTHQSHNIDHNPTLFEHNIAAASGSWWQIDLCTDGTPRGYRVFEINKDSVSWYYKSAGKDSDYQFRLAKNEDGALVANVWNYDPRWKVEWYENNALMGEMKQIEGFDPQVLKLTKDKSEFKYNWIAPTRTSHLFTCVPLLDNSKIEVIVTDRFGRKFRQILKN